MRGFALGGMRPLDGSGQTRAFELPPDALLTHGVIVGMTGSGKTGLLTVLIEEALRSAVPVIMIDIKGDLPNLLLAFPNLAAEEFEPWLDEAGMRRAGHTKQEAAEGAARAWAQKLADWQLGPSDVAELRAQIAPRVFTPGMVHRETTNRC